MAAGKTSLKKRGTGPTSAFSGNLIFDSEDWGEGGNVLE